MESETPTTTDTATAGHGRRRGRRALLRRAKAVGIPTLDNEDLGAIIDHRCAAYMQRRKRLPTLRDASAEVRRSGPAAPGSSHRARTPNPRRNREEGAAEGPAQDGRLP